MLCIRGNLQNVIRCGQFALRKGYVVGPSYDPNSAIYVLSPEIDHTILRFKLALQLDYKNLYLIERLGNAPCKVVIQRERSPKFMTERFMFRGVRNVWRGIR